MPHPRSARVDEHRRRQEAFDALQVERAELAPFGGDRDGIECAYRARVGSHLAREIVEIGDRAREAGLEDLPFILGLASMLALVWVWRGAPAACMLRAFCGGLVVALPLL